VEQHVLRCTQQKTDRALATSFIDTIKAGMPLASKGNVDDSTAGNEALWLSIAQGGLEVADAPFKAAGGTGPTGTRTIATNWAYVDIQWLMKIKTDSEGDVHYDSTWSQPNGERTEGPHEAKDSHGGDRLVACQHTGQRQAAFHSEGVRLSASD
jgi:hypothetical protein